MEKPDGLVALTPDLLHDALSALTPRDLPGVGARMEKPLHQAGIRAMEQLLALDPEECTQFGAASAAKSCGTGCAGRILATLLSWEQAESIGRLWAALIQPELRTPEGAYAVANKLLHKAAMRLRKARLWASNMTLTIRFAVASSAASSKHSSGIHQQPWARATQLLECRGNQTLMEGLQRLWSQRPADRAHQKAVFRGRFPGQPGS